MLNTMFGFQQFISRQFVLLLFVPAGIGLVLCVVFAQSLPERLLALALLLFCPELAHMAKVDLDNIAAVAKSSASQQPSLPSESEDSVCLNSRLHMFRKIVVSTVVLELLGLYAAPLLLQWGGIVIIFSQLWFNLLAKVQLLPHESQAVVEFGLVARLPVLIADAVALVLLAMWSVAKLRLGLSIALLALIVLFLFIKYGFSASRVR